MSGCAKCHALISDAQARDAAADCAGTAARLQGEWGAAAARSTRERLAVGESVIK